MKILIVEDNRLIADLYKKHCDQVNKDSKRMLKCDIINHVLDYDDTIEYDLALCDWLLGTGTALEIIEKLYAKKCHIAIITCCAFLEEIKSYIKNKNIDLLSKPIGLDALDALIGYAYFKRKYIEK